MKTEKVCVAFEGNGYGYVGARDVERATSVSHMTKRISADVDLGFTLAFDMNVVTKKPRRIERVLLYKIGDQIWLACRKDFVSFPALDLLSDPGLVSIDQLTKVFFVEQ